MIIQSSELDKLSWYLAVFFWQIFLFVPPSLHFSSARKYTATLYWYSGHGANSRYWRSLNWEPVSGCLLWFLEHRHPLVCTDFTQEDATITTWYIWIIYDSEVIEETVELQRAVWCMNVSTESADVEGVCYISEIEVPVYSMSVRDFRLVFKDALEFFSRTSGKNVWL